MYMLSLGCIQTGVLPLISHALHQLKLLEDSTLPIMNVLMERKDFQPGFIYVAHRIGIKESHALMDFALFSSAECLLCGLMIRLQLSNYGPPLDLNHCIMQRCWPRSHGGCAGSAQVLTSKQLEPAIM